MTWATATLRTAWAPIAPPASRRWWPGATQCAGGAAFGLPMAPAEPLFLRGPPRRGNHVGKCSPPTERLTLDQAIRAVTIDAAYMINMETTLAASKPASWPICRAGQRSLRVGRRGLRDIKVWARCFEGAAYPAKRGARADKPPRFQRTGAASRERPTPNRHQNGLRSSSSRSMSSA